MLLTLPARGQDCSPVQRSGFTGGSISLCSSQNIGPQTIGAGESYWTGACGQTGSIPDFYVDRGDADFQIQVYYHFEQGTDACGATLWDGEVPIQIDLWQTGPGPNGLMPCNPTESLAHEIGHILGLGHPTTQCFGEIMGWPGPPRSVSSGDCATADSNWYTPTERQEDQYLALQDCESRCASHCEQEYGGGGFYCPVEGQSPIIFDLDNDGFNLTDADHGVNFDLNADRQRERIAWTSSAGSDAWLCRDRNGDGAIGDGRELFGNFTPLANGRRAPNGFEALAEFDAPASGGNGDGQLDSGDRLWTTLLLWIDANHDGHSQPSELMTLAEAGVQSIDLHYIRSNYTDDNGNIFRFRAKAVVRNRKGKFHNSKIYDVFLSTASVGGSGAATNVWPHSASVTNAARRGGGAGPGRRR